MHQRQQAAAASSGPTSFPAPIKHMSGYLDYYRIGMTYAVIQPDLTLRSCESDDDSEVVRRLMRNARVTVLEFGNKLMKVRHEKSGDVGWINANGSNGEDYIRPILTKGDPNNCNYLVLGAVYEVWPYLEKTGCKLFHTADAPSCDEFSYLKCGDLVYYRYPHAPGSNRIYVETTNGKKKGWMNFVDKNEYPQITVPYIDKM